MDLWRTLRSTCCLGSSVDVWVRLDQDDPDLAERQRVCRDFWGIAVNVCVGPRLLGYESGGDFITELAGMAQGEWIALCDDDCVYETLGSNPPLDEQLAGLALEGIYCQAEWYCLNSSIYPSNYGPPGSIVPNGCWRKLGEEKVRTPADQNLYTTCVDQAGWRVQPIAGLILRHNRKEKKT